MNKAFILITIVTLLLLIITGCGKKSTYDEQKNESNTSEEAENDMAGDENGKKNTEAIEDISKENHTGDTKDESDSNTADDQGTPEEQKIFHSEEAGYSGQELLRVDYRARTHAQVEDMDEYYSSMVEKEYFTHSSQIPPELCDLILKAMDERTEEESFEPLIVGSTISQEEFSSLTGKKPEDYEGVLALKVDADNDGIEDIAGLYYYGGTGGFGGMQLYKGMPDGKYELTSSFECFLQAFDYLLYKDKHYLLMEEFDYNTKYYSGYSLYLYEDGRLADGKLFSFAIDNYDMEIVYEDSSYEDIDMVKKTLSNPKIPDILKNNDGVIIGTAETVNSEEEFFPYSADIDNNGVREKYNKYMWYPSNMGTVMHCMYEFEDSQILEDICDKLSEEIGDGRLYTFWIDDVNGKNILYLYFGKNLDFTLYAFLIQKAN